MADVLNFKGSKHRATLGDVVLVRGDAARVIADLWTLDVLMRVEMEAAAGGFDGWRFVWSPFAYSGAWTRWRHGRPERIGFARIYEEAAAEIVAPVVLARDAPTVALVLSPMGVAASLPYFEALGIADRLPAVEVH